MRLFRRGRSKWVAVGLVCVTFLVTVALLQPGSLTAAEDHLLNRGARGGSVVRTAGRGKEGESERVLSKIKERDRPREERKVEEEVEEEQLSPKEIEEEGVREGERKYVPGVQQLELREREGVRERMRERRRKRHELDWAEKDRALSELKASVESVKKDPNQRRLFSEAQRRQAYLDDQAAGNERGDGWKFPEQPLFEVDLGEFGPRPYQDSQLIEADEDNMKRFKFNQWASQNTRYDRELKDVRTQSCRSSSEDYQSNLSPTSVIICFHNEARSALLRTVVSVLHRSPPELLTEIVLVDDFSDNPEDGELLAAIPKVKVFRMEQRSGLMKARVRGAELAEGPILTFLDSHCEVTIGWLQPLLSRIKRNYTHIVSPIIDIINKDTMAYSSASPMVKGGFGHNFNFKWDQISQKDLYERENIHDPIRTPAIAGGLFAVDKTWFTHLGMYDTEMEIWGGENIELSLRVWMCGGVLEIIPCSRVGHIFRSSMPYSFGPKGTYQNTVAKNIRRAVEVWLDEYKTFFYEQNPSSRQVEYGDISERVALREKLHCKSFSWYLKNVYPQFDPPAVQDFTYGQLRRGDMCLDTLGRQYMLPPELRPCDSSKAGLGETQGWVITQDNGIKTHPLCLSYDNSKFFMSTCQGSLKQLFHLHDNGIIQHGPTNSCLGADGFRLRLEPCDPSDPAQIWEFIITTPTNNH